MTPRISDGGMRLRSGASASKMNLLTPTGMGPTRRESSSWSCSELKKSQFVETVDGGGVDLRSGGSDIGELPFKI